MPTWMALHGSRRILIGLFQGTCKTMSSRSGEILSLTVNYMNKPPRRRRRIRHIIHAPSIQTLIILMKLLGKKIHQHPSSPIRITDVSIWPRMERGMYSPCQTLKKREEVGYYSLSVFTFLGSTWNDILRDFIRFLIHINKWFRTWYGQDYTCRALC